MLNFDPFFFTLHYNYEVPLNFQITLIFSDKILDICNVSKSITTIVFIKKYYVVFKLSHNYWTATISICSVNIGKISFITYEKQYPIVTHTNFDDFNGSSAASAFPKAECSIFDKITLYSYLSVQLQTGRILEAYNTSTCTLRYEEWAADLLS